MNPVKEVFVFVYFTLDLIVAHAFRDYLSLRTKTKEWKVQANLLYLNKYIVIVPVK
jgi:hypothetical protein